MFKSAVRVLSVLALTTTPALGVIVNGSDDLHATTPPPNIPGWNSVGSRGGASAVYVGNNWVLTAGHVGAGAVNFGGTSYNFVPGTEVRLVEPGTNTNTDLLLFRIDGTPTVPAAVLASQTPAIGTNVSMIGFGGARAGEAVAYDVVENTPTDWTWTQVSPTSPDLDYRGFQLVNDQRKRWGLNVTEPISTDLGPAPAARFELEDGSLVTLFQTHFNITPGDAQGFSGDSGGGVFNRATGELTGIMIAIDFHPNQPGGTVIEENPTYSANIATYRPQILAIIPEPSALALFPLAALILHRRRR